MKRIQIIICKCGAKISGCTEPECYTNDEYLKDLKKYIEQGCTVDMVGENDFRFQSCKCDPQKQQNDKNNVEYLSLLEKYEKTLDEYGNDPDYDEDEHEVIGYECLGCGHIQETAGMNHDCDKCCGCCLCEIYE